VDRQYERAKLGLEEFRMGTLRTMDLKRRVLNTQGSFMHADGVVLAAYTLDKGFLEVSLPVRTDVGTTTSFEMLLKVTKASVLRDSSGLNTAVWFDFVCHTKGIDSWAFARPCVWTSVDDTFAMNDLESGPGESIQAQLFTEMGMPPPNTSEETDTAFEEVFLKHVDECLRKLVALAMRKRMGVIEESDIVVAETEWSLLD